MVEEEYKCDQVAQNKSRCKRSGKFMLGSDESFAFTRKT